MQSIVVKVEADEQPDRLLLISLTCGSFFADSLILATSKLISSAIEVPVASCITSIRNTRTHQTVGGIFPTHEQKTNSNFS